MIQELTERRRSVSKSSLEAISEGGTAFPRHLFDISLVLFFA